MLRETINQCFKRIVTDYYERLYTNESHRVKWFYLSFMNNIVNITVFFHYLMM